MTLLGVGLAATIFLFVLVARAPDMMAAKCTELLGAAVKIGDITVSLNSIEIERFQIDNPKGYDLSQAFRAEEIIIKAPLTSYVQKHTEIEEIEIKDIYLGLEFESSNGTEGNWTVIMRRGAQQKERDSPSEKRVLIKKIILRNIKTDLLYRNGDGKVKHLPVIEYMELTNVGSEGGDVLDQITESALGSMLKQIFIQENLKNMFNDLLDPNTNLNKALKSFKKLFKTP